MFQYKSSYLAWLFSRKSNLQSKIAIHWWFELKICGLDDPFQRYTPLKSVTTAGRPASRRFLDYVEAGIAHERYLWVKIVDIIEVFINKVFVSAGTRRPLYKSPYHFIVTEALPIWSPASRKYESNAAFTVLIGLPVRALEAISSSCLARAKARATCHFVSIQASTQSRSHHLPVSKVVGPVKILSAVRLQGVNSTLARGTCHWHMLRAILWASRHQHNHVPIICMCRTSSVR